MIREFVFDIIFNYFEKNEMLFFKVWFFFVVLKCVIIRVIVILIGKYKDLMECSCIVCFLKNN